MRDTISSNTRFPMSCRVQALHILLRKDSLYDRFLDLRASGCAASGNRRTEQVALAYQGSCH